MANNTKRGPEHAERMRQIGYKNKGRKYSAEVKEDMRLKKLAYWENWRKQRGYACPTEDMTTEQFAAYKKSLNERRLAGDVLPVGRKSKAK